MQCPRRKHIMTKLTVISCKRTGRPTCPHNEMRDELGHCARRAGVHPGKGETRSQPWSSNAGGADAKYTGFTVGGPTDKSTVLVDVTYPTAVTQHARQLTGNKRREVERRGQQQNSKSASKKKS